MKEVRMKLTYLDQAENLKYLFPIEGLLLSQYYSSNGTTGFYRFNLDNPPQIQLKINEPFGFKLIIPHYFVIRSKEHNKILEKDNGVSVHVFIPVNKSFDLKNGFNLESLWHATWAISEHIK